MTLNDLERCNSLIIRFFPPISVALIENYVTAVEGRPDRKYCLPVPVSTFGHS